MPHTANRLAENASFQAFANCYIREVDPGVWHIADNWQRQTGISLEHDEPYVLELQLIELGITLGIGVSYRSIVGRHLVTNVYRKQQNPWDWQRVDSVSVIVMMIDNIYAKSQGNRKAASQKLELLNRTLESHQIMQEYLVQRQNDSALDHLGFIESEQSLLFGHWLHPTPKSRQGIHSWQHKNYTPELKASFALHFFAVSRQLLQQNSLIEQSVEQIINQIAEVDCDAIDVDKQLVPVHPLQAHWLQHQDYIQQLLREGLIEDLGVMGKKFTPTSSVRTLYCAELNYMIKLSIPVKITNSLRKNKAHELEPGLNVGKLLAQSDFSEKYPQFAMIEDPAYITVKLPGMQESGFETIIRQNPFTENAINQRATLSIAALVQEPILAGCKTKLTQQVEALAQEQKKSLNTAAQLWFDCYWHCAIDPAIRLYDSHGVALEAHQQNSLITISNNRPSQYYYRDNQGFYLSQSMREQLLQREPSLNQNLDLFYDDDAIADRVGYYLFINQLFSVISRLGQDGLVSELALLERCYRKLTQLKTELNGVGVHFIEQLFNKATIPCKANLLTRVEDVDELEAEQELAVYTDIRNPIFDFHQKAMSRLKAGDDVGEETEEGKNKENEVTLESA
ncbi:short-chain oxidoreductase [Saccharobesus litoralis]|uniref:Short-chain oxidoreductase n=1 Tax=Saccharobesus litoralis TaxID=2172099 RepID=A0A2S0VPW8_9ALTE|nr:IucA/IucC family protein [Saccharobesus litoralis]AWB66130.1 short-chain oxidoreductase [Saccharobesus litoralis]